MASLWDLLPAGLWPLQPFVWPTDPMQPSPRPQETAPPQTSAPATLAFGWAPAPVALASKPTFGWAAAPPAPANAPAYSGVTDPDAFLGSFGGSETLDPARTARLLEDANRAHDFAKWAFGPLSVRPAQQTRYAAAATGAPRPSGPTAGTDDGGAPPSPIAATEVPASPTNWGNGSNAPVGNPDIGPGVESATQAPGLGAATGNPHIERQGDRIRASAAKRNPPPALVRAAADDFGHGLRETPLQVVGGVRDAGQALIDFQNWAADNHVPIIPGVPGFLTPHALFDLPDVSQPASVTGGTVRAVSQFLAGFAAGGPIAEATALPRGAQALLRAAGADFFFRSGHDRRLSDLIEEVPALKNPVTAYLKSDPNDGEAEGRLKNAIEGLGIGTLGAGLFHAFGALRQQRLLRTTVPPPPPPPDEPIGPRPAHPTTEGLAEPTVGPSDIEAFRVRYNVPTLHTIAVARTSVPGLEEVTLKGASPFVRDEAGLPRATRGLIEPPSIHGFDQGHAEEDVVNQFLRAVRELGLKPSDLNGHKLVIYVSNPRGVCPTCRQEDPPGVLKQLSNAFRGLTIEVRVQTQPGITPRGPTNFTIRGGLFDTGATHD